MFEQELARDATTLAVRRHFPEDDRTFYWRPLAGNAHGWSTGEQIESFISGTARQVGRFADAAEPLGPMAALFSAASLEAAAEALPGRQPALEAALGEAHPESVEAAEVLTADAAPPMDEPAPAIPRHLKRLERGPPDRHHADGPLAPEAPWARAADDVCIDLEVDPAQGLSASEAARRLVRHGPNQLRAPRRRPAWHVLLDQFKSLVIALLGVATGLAFVVGETLEGWAVLVVIAISVGIGFVTELRAVRSMEALVALGHVMTRVRRGGHIVEVPAENLVLGDVVVVEAGDVVTADLRLVEASKMQADESALTGESLPVPKGVVPVAPEAPVADRAPMLYKGTAVTRGAGLAVVTRTGMGTELGTISALVGEAGDEATPLERQLAVLGRTLIGATLAVAAFVIASGVLAGKDLVLMVETGLALAVAAVPEGLPVVATIALARGVHRMARRNALLNRLASVETLGSTGVILTDKTGTLTENQMTATRLLTASGLVEVTGEGLETDGGLWRGGAPAELASDAALSALIEAGVLCNDASFTPGASRQRPAQASGDPMEVALLVLGAKMGLLRGELLSRWPEVREEAFDPEVKMMATVHARGASGEGPYRTAVKGGPGAVLGACSHELAATGAERPLAEADREAWLERNREMGSAGLRVLAVATKMAPEADADPYRDLRFVGLVGFQDPPREDVREALAACHAAGIDVVMVTGDQPSTALGVGRAVGLVTGEAAVVTGAELGDLRAASQAERQRLLATRLFARVTPKQKLDLIALHQAAGRIVAMTGDGVNDAPALKKADIGVAMGMRGTQVAREAADMVLLDDAFATIVEAVRQGRVILGNVRRFAFYLLSCNVSEVMVVGLAAGLGTTLPLLPLQILFLNLVTDVLPALALGMGEGDRRVMGRPPRDRRDPILGRREWAGILGYGALITLAVLGALWVAEARLGLDARGAVTVSFLSLAFAQLWHVFNMRAAGSGPVSNEVTRNPYVWGALGACLTLLLCAVYVPGLARVLHVEPPSASGWAVILGASVVPLVGREVHHLFHEHLWRRSGPA